MFSTIKQNWKRHLQNTRKVWTRKEKRKKLQQRPLIMSSKRCYRKELKDWRRWISMSVFVTSIYLVVRTSIQYKMSHINYFQFDDKPEEELPAHQPEMRQSKSRPGSQPQQSPPPKTQAATKLPPPRRAAPVAAAAADQESEFARVFNQLRRDKQRPEQLVA